jgi:hypothetical protein
MHDMNSPHVDDDSDSEHSSHKRGYGNDNSSDNKRRRFVWPDPLHHDFVAAVFDVGLKNATAEHVYDLMCREDPRCAAFINLSNLQAHICRLLVMRDRSNPEYCSYYESSLNTISNTTGEHVGHNGTNNQESTIALRPAGSSEESRMNQRLLLLRRQLEVVNNTIKVQSKFLSLVKTSMESQLRVQAGVIQVISRLDPSYTVPLQNNNQQQQLLLSSLPTYSSIDTIQTNNGDGDTTKATNSEGSSSTRVELQIMSEMRSHMDLHRQLLLRKEDQVSQFSVRSEHGEAVLPLKEQKSVEDNSSGVVAQEWNWDDEHLDERLFNFLDET